MKLQKYIVLVAAVFTFFSSTAQQNSTLIPIQNDSVVFELQRNAEYHQLVSGINSDFLINEIPQFPKFDFKSNFISDYNFNSGRFFSGDLPANGLSLGSPIPFFSPFYGNATVLSQGIYQLNSKFSVGGYSYGVNSPFSAPLPNAFENFDRYGSTFFMQYKVSKNFKIETRVNVSQGGHPGF